MPDYLLLCRKFRHLINLLRSAFYEMIEWPFGGFARLRIAMIDGCNPPAVATNRCKQKPISGDDAHGCCVRCA